MQPTPATGARAPVKDPLRDPAPLVRRVYAYAAYRLGDGADAEDVTSETFERALRYRESFDPKRGTPAAWLVGIARRCADDQLRAARDRDADRRRLRSSTAPPIAAVGRYCDPPAGSRRGRRHARRPRP